MNFIVVGANHKSSPVEFRERLSLSKSRLKDAILFLKERSVLEGAVILSTCNRVEVYASTRESKAGIKEIEDFIPDITRLIEIDSRITFIDMRARGRSNIYFQWPAVWIH